MGHEVEIVALQKGDTQHITTPPGRSMARGETRWLQMSPRDGWRQNCATGHVKRRRGCIGRHPESAQFTRYGDESRNSDPSFPRFARR